MTKEKAIEDAVMHIEKWAETHFNEFYDTEEVKEIWNKALKEMIDNYS